MNRSSREPTPAAPSRSTRGVRALRNAIVAVPALAMLTAADGDCAFAWLTIESPVQAVTMVLEQPDGEVRAEVMIVSTAEWNDHRWVDTAEQVELRIPGGAIVPLEPVGDGRYRASSNDNPDLAYLPGERYRLTFELDDREAAKDHAGEEFIAVLDAPADAVSFSLDRAPAFVGDTAELSWSSSDLDALIEVRDSKGELIYTSFDLSHPQFDGSKWGSLASWGRHTLPVDVFDAPGTYTIEACVVASREGLDEELSAALGLMSGFLAGKCFEPIELEVTE